MNETQIEDGAQVTVPYYIVTMVCPLCHQSITWKQDGITVCPHCGKSFVVKSVADNPYPGSFPEREGGGDAVDV